MLERMIHALGVVVMMGIAFFCPSSLCRKTSRRTIGLGMAVLIGFAFLVLGIPVNYAFVYANDVVETLLNFSKDKAKA